MTRTTSRLPFAATLAIATLCTLFAAEAAATCVTAPSKNRFAAPIPQALPAAAQSAGDRADDDAADMLVGMWRADFLVGDALYDQTLQQFHSDGTENILSNGLPPALGNVCLGIWKRVGPRTFKLRHLAWNWDADGTFAGLFEMIVTFTVNRSGEYRGTFVADSYDLSNERIPELHVEGEVTALRLAVE